VLDGIYGQIAAVGAVLLLLVLTLTLLRKKGSSLRFRLLPGPGNQTLRILGRKALTSQHALFDVEVEGVRFLAATSPSGLQLMRLETGFADALRTSLEKREEAPGRLPRLGSEAAGA
jgi:hypothetical protein